MIVTCWFFNRLCIAWAASVSRDRATVHARSATGWFLLTATWWCHIAWHVDRVRIYVSWTSTITDYVLPWQSYSVCLDWLMKTLANVVKRCQWTASRYFMPSTSAQWSEDSLLIFGMIPMTLRYGLFRNPKTSNQSRWYSGGPTLPSYIERT